MQVLQKVDQINVADTSTSTDGLRVAILSSPRSGNTWLRHLLANIYSAAELAAHNPADLNWEELPSDCILQLHWHRTSEFLDLLRDKRFHIVVIARHPLDVLLSVLHYAMHDDSPRRWLEGEGGNEADIFGAMPCSAAFLRYATSPRASRLLSVSKQWWELPGATRVHYERLVADPMEELLRLTNVFELPLKQPLADAIAANEFSSLCAHSGTAQAPERRHHFWRGKPGHWHELMTANAAHTIAAAHAELFDALGYECDPDLELTQTQADANWINLHREELTARLRNHESNKQQLEQVGQQVSALEKQRDELLSALERKHADVLAAVADARQVREAMAASKLHRMTAALRRFFTLGA